MTDIKKKALALVEALKRDELTYDQRWKLVDLIKTQAREIEQHEAFRQEVSDAVESRWMNILAMKCEDVFSRFIIPKPDPLVEIWNHMIDTGNFGPDALRNAMKDRGYEWTKTSESNNES